MKVNIIKGNPVGTIQSIRKDLDEHLKVLTNIQEVERSRYLSMAYTNTEMGRAWMGKLLSLHGNKNPYEEKDGNRKTVEDIIPATDKSEGCRCGWKKLTIIEKLDTMRVRLEEIILYIEEEGATYSTPSKSFILDNATSTRAAVLLQEARMAIGMELGRIRDKTID